MGSVANTEEVIRSRGQGFRGWGGRRPASEPVGGSEESEGPLTWAGWGGGSQPTWAAVTKRRGLGRLNIPWIYFLQTREQERPRSKASARSAEGPLPGWRLAPSHWVLGVDGVRELSGASFSRTLIPGAAAPRSGSQHLPKAHLLTPSLLRARIPMGFGRDMSLQTTAGGLDSCDSRSRQASPRQTASQPGGSLGQVWSQRGWPRLRSGFRG